ncbi:hypothetical protein Pdw03_0784 [Penicillium digitatum]|uniref:Uncharacterized protein n=1 Tax=Penicillium digitatum TaxID=36651 RepID=A0A7T7BN43_PENDI|nr:hypothetical protein Pdw03_0784 [Penicillium digitatum]
MKAYDRADVLGNTLCERPMKLV